MSELPKCSFCGGVLRIQQPIRKDPEYRCWRCKIIVTNQSYMPKHEHDRYWKMVSEKKIMSQVDPYS